MPSAETVTSHIALCCNGTMLPGLHATLDSLVRNLGSREAVTLHLFVEGLTEAERNSIRETVEGAGGVGTYSPRQADISIFKGLQTLHGSWMTYLRLLLPQLIPEADIILYLDSDLVINTDVCAITNYPLNGSPLAATRGATVEWSLDRDFLKLVGLTYADRTFNAGILLFDADLWRKTGLVEKSLEIARTHNSALTSHDQSVLNAMFSRNFSELPKEMNILISPQDKLLTPADGIYHFAGSPKPWDPFGKLFHGNWKLWHDVIQQTKFRWSDFLSQHLSAYIQRAWSLRRSYLRSYLRR